MGQRKVLVCLGSHGNIADMALCGCLIALKLFDGRFYNVLFRLRSLVDHIQIRPLKMDA